MEAGSKRENQNPGWKQASRDRKGFRMPVWNHNENTGGDCKAKHRKPCDSEFGVQPGSELREDLLQTSDYSHAFMQISPLEHQLIQGSTRLLFFQHLMACFNV